MYKARNLSTKMNILSLNTPKTFVYIQSTEVFVFLWNLRDFIKSKEKLSEGIFHFDALKYSQRDRKSKQVV